MRAMTALRYPLGTKLDVVYLPRIPFAVHAPPAIWLGRWDAYQFNAWAWGNPGWDVWGRVITFVVW